MAYDQDILDEPKVDDLPDQKEGPGPILSEENRKKLDAIVLKMQQNKESDQNIQTVVNDFKTKYSSATNQFAAAHQNAQQQLQTELTGNKDIIPSIVKKQKTSNIISQGQAAFAMQPRSDMPQTAVQQIGQRLAGPVAPVTVSDQEVEDYDKSIASNDQSARGFLHQVQEHKPEKKKTIQSAMYLADASPRVNDDKKAQEVLGNADKINSGELTYNVNTGHLQKPEGVWESLKTGLKSKNQSFADYNLFSNLSPKDAITELEKRRSAYNPDEPTPVPEGAASGLAEGLSSQPLKGLVAGKVAGGVTALIPGAEEFAPATDQLVTAAVSGNDFRKITYANALQKYYNELRNQGTSPEEAYDKANSQAKDESKVDAIAGGAMMLAGGRIGSIEVPRFGLSNGFKEALKTGIKQTIKGVGEAGAVGALQGIAQDAKNKLADLKRIQRDESGRDIGEAMESGALFTLGMAVLAKGAGSLTKATKNGILLGLAKVAPKKIDEELGHQIMDGTITPAEAKEAKTTIQDFQTTNASIPDNVTDESKLKIQDKIARRGELEKQLETADKAYHPDIKEKIKAVNEDILELSKDKKPRGEKDVLDQEPSVEQNNISRGTFLPTNEYVQPESAFRTLDYGDNKGQEENKPAQDKIENEILEDKPIGNTGDKLSTFIQRVIPAFQGMLKDAEHNTVLVTHSSVIKALRVWEDMGRPEVNNIDVKEFARRYVDLKPEKEGEVASFKGDNGKNIKVVRHGETEDNVASEFRTNDTPLTDKGIAQARTAGQNIMKATGGQVPKIVTSDLPRAVHTSDVIRQQLQGTKGGLNPGDMVISKHFEGPQQVRSVSEDGKSVYIEGQDHHVHEIPIEDITLKIKNNASTVRGDKGQVQEGGNAPEGRQETRSNDLQQHTEETPVNAETQQPTGTGQVGDPEVTRLAHKNTEELYEELGTSGRVPRETKEDTKLEAEADELIKNGYDFIGKANKVLDGTEQFIDAEQVAFAKMVGALKAKLNVLDIKSPEFDHIQNQIELLTRASDKVGSELGATMRARRMFVLNDQTLSDYLQQDKESLGVDTLTDQQKEKNKKEFDDIQQKQTEYDQKIKDLEEENAKLKAEAAVKKTKSGTSRTKKSHDDFVKERKSIVDDMRADLLKAAKGQGGLTASVPGVAQLAAIAPHVLKLVKSLAEEGIDKLEDVVKSIHGDLKDVLEGITEKDVHDIIAGEYTEKKKTKNELAAKVKDLRDEAKLINELERLQNGEEPKSEKKKTERNQRIKDLKDKIKDLKGDASKLSAVKSRNESELKKVQDQLDKGDYSEPEKKVPILENKELQKKYPELYKAALASRDKLIAAKNEREIRILRQQYANRPKLQKITDAVGNVLNTPRALMSSMDFSAPLRQGLWGVTKEAFSHPGDLANQFKTMFKMAGSQKIFDRWFTDLKEAPDYGIMQKAGLPLADPHDPKLAVQEEAFMNNIAEKLPLGIGKLIKGSERAYVGFLNKMRVDIFRRAADTFASSGKTFENSPELYKAMADYVGAATGRGKMPEIMEKSAPILNAAFFSPRLIASRLNLLTNWANPKFYTKIPKEIRVQYFKDMAKFIGLGTTVLALAKMGGAQVEDDPRSSDFGKIRSGNTRWDIWGGFQQYVRLAAQLITGQKKSTTSGNITELNGKGPYGETRADVLMRFARGKLAPVPAETIDLLKGRDVTGNPVTLESEAAKNLPLVLMDIKQAYDDGGVKSALGVGVPSMFGVGVQTYGDTKGGGNTGGGGASSSFKIKEYK